MLHIFFSLDTYDLNGVETYGNCSPCPSSTTGGIITSFNFPNDFGVSPANSYSECKYKFATSTGGKVVMTLSAGANMDYMNQNPNREYIVVSNKIRTLVHGLHSYLWPYKLHNSSCYIMKL